MTVSDQGSGDHARAESLVNSGLNDMRRPQHSHQRVPRESTAVANVLVRYSSVTAACGQRPDVLAECRIRLEFVEVLEDVCDGHTRSLGDPPCKMQPIERREVVVEVRRFSRREDPSEGGAHLFPEMSHDEASAQ